ncbi:hypothetical protein HELRODRAFT_62123, partial [Helobdella robusta]|uniref:ATP-grasp domain-containing protein n=1 Tax=Helobdella robusta TaxID=6412 RepID=T1FWW1_HELRO
SRIFYGRKLFGDYDLKVEQAQFSEINLSTCSSMGTTVEIRKSRPDHHTRSAFQPDFVLIRQHVKNISNDYTNIVLGLRNGGVASVNSLDSIFNFLDKPWVFAHLIRIQRKIGKNKFPLISQSYYPNFKEMLVTPHFPVVVKMGHGHSGLGKVKVDHHYGFQDIASVAAMTNSYSTTELLIDSQCDIFVQKIGTNIRAFKRKCMSGNWKASMGAVILEPMPMNERYKSWVDECSKLFGGLDMMCIQIMQGKDGKEYIVEMNDSTMSILGSSQSEDYKLVVDLVISKMEQSSTFHKFLSFASNF